MSDVFLEAIAAHHTWVTRFQNALKGTNREPLDPKLIRDDSRCQFGLWLHANPDAFPSADTYKQVMDMHKAFHETASEIAIMIRQQYQRESIDIYMEAFHTMSKQMVATLQAVKSADRDKPR
jgi:hypothetical protein